MFRVGLTGNVASGKSLVARLFDAWGATVIDADRLTRDVQRPGSPILQAIAQRFGATFIAGDGSLDRDALRRHVMADDQERAALNSIVHPAVQAARKALVEAARDRGDLLIVSVIPLLFEVLDPAHFDVVVLVHASEATRRRRLLEFRELPAEDADRLLAAQQPSEAKRAHSHIVLDNEGSLADLERAAWDAWRTLRAKAASASARTAGALMTVVAHPADAARAVGGTLARYTDAGYDIHVVSATDPIPATVLDFEQTALRRTAGHIDANDGAAIRAVSAVLRQQSPSVLITLDPESFAHADHRAVHHWTTRAVAEADVTTRLMCAARADGTRGSIVLDVRPWGDIILQLAAEVSAACDVDAPQRSVGRVAGRERYVAQDGQDAPEWELSDAAQRG